ncbi:GntR family transcriptional regulator [Microvirga pudoricolor]|uniref:GntR family transcriptional regulator n=1 Tax=Microvirga pudoricolor TaxID=2778729 RepID=UPI0019500373|nr:GntR family transcriptional regulator [Microvirga pudoricolor]MBM6593323.1 GntR family transcriptional regulator [Microvirga pudoricolor]
MTDQAAALPPFGTLDEANPTPLYLQLQHFIEEAVRNGSLKMDAALPGERDLAKQLGISRVTVRKAIMGLVKKGVLIQRWGSGTFVAQQMRLEQPLSRLSSFTDDMSARGMQSSAVLLSRSVGVASTDELMALGLSPGETVSRVNRLRMADGTPLAIEHAVVPTRYLPDPSLVKQSLYAVLHEGGYMPVRALQRLHAVLLSDEQAQLLKVPPLTPALYIERRSFTTAGEAVEFTSSYYRGDAYDFVAELTIGQPQTDTP